MEKYDKIPRGRKQKQEMKNKRFGELQKVIEKMRLNHVIPVNKPKKIKQNIYREIKEELIPKMKSIIREKKRKENNKKK